MTTTVVNIKSGKPYDVYIGRNMSWVGRPEYRNLTRSKWANQFQVDIYNKDGTIKKKRDGTNEEVVFKYLKYLPTQEHLMASLPELKDKVLGCWCKPKLCHGDVLVMMVRNDEKWASIFRTRDPFLIRDKINEVVDEHEAWMKEALEVDEVDRHLRRKFPGS